MLTDAQSRLRDGTFDFAKTQLGSGLAARDAAGAADLESWRDDWQRAADFGLLRLLQATDLGGAGCDVVQAAVAMEGLGMGCADNGLIMHLCAQVFAIQEPIRSFGSAAQRAAYLPDLGSGATIGAFALTEADVGSEALALQTTASRDGDDYVLNGEKSFIGMAPVADVFVVFASTNLAHKNWGLSVFIVHATDPGVTRTPPQEKIGLRTVPMGGVQFDDCRIPADRILGKQGAGQGIFQHAMLWERSLILASHVGAMARQLDETAAYARGRIVGGKPIMDHQSVSNRLADMALRVETSRMMLYRAAQELQDGTATPKFAAMANLAISEAFLESSLDAVRINGGRGVLAGMGPEQDLRDAVGGVIYSGTSDIQRQIIASLL